MIIRDQRNSAGARRSRRLIGAGCAVAAILATMPVLLADRLTDRDVKALLERIDEERDRFEDQLDGKLKSSVLRGPSGEVNVARFLDDLQENIDKMKERFKPEYAASAEVTTVLRQASDIQRFMSKQPANFDGASEWNRLNGSLSELAAAYQATLPLPEGQSARRITDREVKLAAEELEKTADSFQEGPRHDAEGGQGRRCGDPPEPVGRGRRPQAGRQGAGLGRRRQPAGIRRSQSGVRPRGQGPRDVRRADALAGGADLLAVR